jgi:2-polyprenyl-3-methyl-5-hydroxy-6-metoxy-1,4-benzoquinol methylase
MELISCNLCGSTRYQTHLIGKDLNLYLEGTFHIVECLDCGLVYLNPRPSREEVEAYYPFESYDQYNLPLSSLKSRLTRADRAYGLLKRAKKVSKWKRNGRLLDVGCATGDFLEYMQSYGDWEVYGMDINPKAVRFVREQLDIPVYYGMLGEIGLPSDHFDVVTMWHVLEHVFDPVQTLEEVARILRSDGVFLFQVPQLDSLDAKLFGRYWIGYEIPRHTYIWSQNTLRRLIDATGFCTLETACFYGSYAASASSMRFWLRDNLKYDLVRRLFENLLFSRPMRLAFAPYFFIVDHLRLSSSLVVVCAQAKKQ